MKKLFQGLFKLLCKPSTKPDITSYKWARRAPSLLASVLLWTLWFCRTLSLYQHIKLLYRGLGEKFRFGYTENASGRPDVPPWLGEVYFLLFTALFSITHHFQISATWLQILAGYYLFESSLWILYYTVFRRFFELGYTIYHQLEYITTIILIIPTQAVCFSHLYAISFHDALTGLLGAGSESFPLLITVFSYVLSAIVIGMIISNFPAENIKKCGKKAKMLILGCGDVVKSRLYPAIVRSDLAVDTAVYDLTTASDRLPICQYFGTPEELVSHAGKALNHNSVVWVETPPDSHFFYIRHFLKSPAKLLVVEKPVTTDRLELEALTGLLRKPRNRNRLFFLSYYILEKALPLSYLATFTQRGGDRRRSAYAKYLQIEGTPLVSKWDTLLGKLRSVDIHVYEGTDSRKWVADHATGGHLFETFLHNVLIASIFCGPVDNWNVIDFSDADYTQTIHRITLEASCGETSIHLSMKKNYAARYRGATLIFENGTIQADFDKKLAEIRFDQLNTVAKLQVAEEYRQNYCILTDLVGRVISGEYTPAEIDGLGDQPEVLRWLFQLRESHAETACKQ